ncbi:MAG TPA: hypothetical protein VKV19_00390 [Ktedonobacteraceae bacterium]|jgi:hypothetical protein|nr:hypothetical protein [Ktedonobacteraceae bacterium]
MAQIRIMREDEAERVRDLWLQMCAEVGTPLSAASAQQILTNLKQYPALQDVRCFVAEEQQVLIGFLTCSISGHPVLPGRSGEIEELYVRSGPDSQIVEAEMVKQAVIFLQTQGAGSIHTRVGIGAESPEEGERRAFWQALGWENDMTIYSIYRNVPGNPTLQRIWNAYKTNHQTIADDPH